MSKIDLFVLMLCCFLWAGNFVVTAWILGDLNFPPFLFALSRAAMILVFMLPWLFRPLPINFGKLLFICFLSAPVHLGLLYLGLQTATASASSLTNQVLIPLTTLFSVIILGEKIGWIRSTAIGIAMIGVSLMIYDPKNTVLDIGLIYIFLATVAVAIATVLMKKIGHVPWQDYVIWSAAILIPIMILATFLFETAQFDHVKAKFWPFLFSSIFSAILSTIVAHGQFFRLIQKYDVTFVVPLTLMTPFFTIILGAILLDDSLTSTAIFGAFLLLPCAYIIARRQNR